jgi:anti-sigma regulatory factor (Ser/Thr protein kinase)
MSTDPGPGGPTECILNNDPRLIAGAAALASHVARRAGLSERAQEDLYQAVAEACRQAFQMSGRARRTGATIHLAVESFPDRVEVAVEYPEGKGATAAEAARSHAPAAALPVDHIERTKHDGRCRMTIVKYCGVAKSSSRA